MSLNIWQAQKVRQNVNAVELVKNLILTNLRGAGPVRLYLPEAVLGFVG